MNTPPSRLDTRIAAIVINFNGGEKTLRTLDALTRQSLKPDPIIVVDNGSSDGSAERIVERFPEAHLVRLEENLGLPSARNVGLATASTSLVLLVDSDVYLEPGCLETLVRAHVATGATVVCPRIRLIPERDIVQADGAAAHFIGTMTLRHGYEAADVVPDTRSRVTGCIGACYLLDRMKVLAEGGFDETYFFYFEDLEFMLRLGARGHDFICEPEAVVFHERGAGTPGLSFRGRGPYPPLRTYLSLRNRWLTVLLHYETRTLLLLTPAFAVYEIAALVGSLAQGNGREWLRSWSWLARNARTTLARRRLFQSRRVRHDREILSGGPLPLAPGLAGGRAARAAAIALSSMLNVYWRAVRPLVR